MANEQCSMRNERRSLRIVHWSFHICHWGKSRSPGEPPGRARWHGAALSGCWLLLGQAVERAEPKYEVDGMNAHHRPVAEQFAERAERDAVVRVIERRDDHRRVADVKIRVARRQPPIAEVQRRRHRQRYDLRTRTVL